MTKTSFKNYRRPVKIAGFLFFIERTTFEPLFGLTGSNVIIAVENREFMASLKKKLAELRKTLKNLQLNLVKA